MNWNKFNKFFTKILKKLIHLKPILKKIRIRCSYLYEIFFDIYSLKFVYEFQKIYLCYKMKKNQHVLLPIYEFLIKLLMNKKHR